MSTCTEGMSPLEIETLPEAEALEAAIRNAVNAESRRLAVKALNRLYDRLEAAAKGEPEVTDPDHEGPSDVQTWRADYHDFCV